MGVRICCGWLENRIIDGTTQEQYFQKQGSVEDVKE